MPQIPNSSFNWLLAALLALRLVVGQPDSGGRSDDATGPLEVWILAGQSNMEGQNGRDNQLMPECATPWPTQILSFPRAKAEWWTGDSDAFPASSWIPAEPNTCLFASSHRLENNSLGPEMAFAKTLIRAGAAKRVGFVPTTAGGSSVYLDWGQWSLKHGLVGILVAVVKRAMQAAEPGSRLAGMVWVQGEGDATVAAGLGNATQYEHNLRQLFHTIRRGVFRYNPMLPIVMAVQATKDRDRVFPYIHTIRRHQMNLRLPALVKVDMEGFEMMPDDFTEMYGPQVGVQMVHITKQGQCAFGEALANAYLAQKAGLERVVASARGMEPMME